MTKALGEAGRNQYKRGTMVAKEAKSESGAKQEATSPPKKSGQSSKKVPLPPEPEPILSGRMVVALALALAMSLLPSSGLGRIITKTSPQTADRATWVVGQKATVHLTIVTSDYEKLGCADKRTAKNQAHCAYKNEKERFPDAEEAPVDDNKATILQPYRTTDKNLLLAPGLWAQPAVAMRLHEEPPQGVSQAKLARFVVACEATFLEEWEGSLIRWSPSEKWSDQGKAMVANLSDCQILKDTPE